MKLLRDPKFQKLLVSYERARPHFIVAHETIDEVSSRVLIRDAAGNEYRPDDYLAAFSRFVSKKSGAHRGYTYPSESSQRLEHECLRGVAQKARDYAATVHGREFEARPRRPL